MGESDMSYGDYLQLDKLLDAPSHRVPTRTTKCCSSSSIRPLNCG